MLLDGLGYISQVKSPLVIEELVNKNLFDFVDGDDDAKDFIDAILKKARRVKLIWKRFQVL